MSTYHPNDLYYKAHDVTQSIEAKNRQLALQNEIEDAV